MDITKAPWAEWMEETLQMFCTENVEKIVIAGIDKHGEVVTGWSGLGDTYDFAKIVSALQADLTMKIVTGNIDKVKEALDEE